MKNLNYLILSALFTVLILSGCESDKIPSDGNTTDLVGLWKLDDVTLEWLDRACVILDFNKNDDATFEFIKLNDDEIVLRFNNVAHTSWRGKIHRRVFDASQILPTTLIGSRVCGESTTVRVVIRYNAENPNQIEGTWQTPHCSYCPDRVFDAVRIQL